MTVARTQACVLIPATTNTQRPQNFLKLCTKECAIAFLDYHCIYRLHFEFAEKLRPFRASYGDTYVVLSHFKKGVA